MSGNTNPNRQDTGIANFVSDFSSLTERAIDYIDSIINGLSNVVSCKQSSLWLGTNDGEFEIFSASNVPDGKEFILTEIVFRSLGTLVAMAGLTFDLKYKAETEPDPSTINTINFDDLDLIPSDDVPIAARIGCVGGLDDRLNRRGAITVECATLRAHDVWIDVIGYYVDRNEES